MCLVIFKYLFGFRFYLFGYPISPYSIQVQIFCLFDLDIDLCFSNRIQIRLLDKMSSPNYAHIHNLNYKYGCKSLRNNNITNDKLALRGLQENFWYPLCVYPQIRMQIIMKIKHYKGQFSPKKKPLQRTNWP